jgi:hypothetical protein
MGRRGSSGDARKEVMSGAPHHAIVRMAAIIFIRAGLSRTTAKRSPPPAVARRAILDRPARMKNAHAHANNEASSNGGNRQRRPKDALQRRFAHLTPLRFGPTMEGGEDQRWGML